MNENEKHHDINLVSTDRLIKLRDVALDDVQRLRSELGMAEMRLEQIRNKITYRRELERDYK